MSEKPIVFTPKTYRFCIENLSFFYHTGNQRLKIPCPNCKIIRRNLSYFFTLQKTKMHSIYMYYNLLQKWHKYCYLERECVKIKEIMETMIELKKVDKYYKSRFQRTFILKNVDFTVNEEIGRAHV